MSSYTSAAQKLVILICGLVCCVYANTFTMGIGYYWYLGDSSDRSQTGAYSIYSVPTISVTEYFFCVFACLLSLKPDYIPMMFCFHLVALLMILGMWFCIQVGIVIMVGGWWRGYYSGAGTWGTTYWYIWGPFLDPDPWAASSVYPYNELR